MRLHLLDGHPLPSDPIVRGENFLASHSVLRCPMDTVARRPKACRTPRDAIALPSEVFFRSIWQMRMPPHGLRRLATIMATERCRTFPGIPTGHRDPSRLRTAAWPRNGDVQDSSCFSISNLQVSKTLCFRSHRLEQIEETQHSSPGMH